MKQDARRLPPKVQEALRRRAVAAVREEGLTQVAAARAFGVSRQSVRLWLQAHRKRGDAGLAARKRGPKKGRGKLKSWQAATTSRLIRDRHPEQVKMPFALWTSDAVRQLIQRRFGVKLAGRTVRRHLQRWGFTPQKPVRTAYERDPKGVAQWLETEYPAIRARANREKACIYWGDEMGIRSDHQAGRSYAPRGKTPTRVGTGQRFGANVISAITNRGSLAFMVFKATFTAKVFVRFLRRLAKHAGRKAFLIVDRHGVHRSGAVRDWLAAHAARIEMFLLPGYSPDLNPDEMLNQDVKTNAVGKRSPRNRPQMVRAVRRHLERRRRDPELVRRYFHEKSVRYAAG